MVQTSAATDTASEVRHVMTETHRAATDVTHRVRQRAQAAVMAPVTARNQVSTAQGIAEPPAAMAAATALKTVITAIPTADHAPPAGMEPATARRPLSTAQATAEATAAMVHAMVRNQRRTAQPIAEAPAAMEPVTGPKTAVPAIPTAERVHTAAMAAVTGQSTVATARWIAAPAEANSAVTAFATG
jgi:hypothetical protein